MNESNLSIADYLNQLVIDKSTLVSNLQAKGVPVTGDETFTELAPAVSEIPTSKSVAVEFYDYDGTIFASYSKEEALALTSLPAGPVHTDEGLVFDGWNWTLEEIKNYVTRYPEGEVIVGSLFNTDTGATKIYVSLTKDTLNPEVRIDPKLNTNIVTINWGDGSAEESYSQSVAITATHLYSAPGDYVISIKSTGATTYNGNANCTPSFFGAAGYTGSTANKGKYKNTFYWQRVTKLQFGRNVVFTVGIQFQYVPLAYMTFPNDTTLGSSSSVSAFFAGAYCLKYVAFPRGFTTFSGSVFNGCTSVIVALPGNVTKFNVTPSIINTFAKLTIPDSCTEFYGSNTQWGLKKLVLPRQLNYSNIQIPSDVEELYIYCVFSSLNGEAWVVKFNQATNAKLRVLKYFGDAKKLDSISGNFCGINFNTIDTNVDLTTFKSIGTTDTFRYATKECFDLTNVTSGYQFTNTFGNAVTKKVLFGPSVTLSSGGTNNSGMFSSCYTLAEVSLPNGIINMASMFSYAPIDTIKIPSTVTTIGSSAFNNCYALRIMDFSNHTEIPSIATSYSSSGYPSLEYVIVPDNLYETWITTGNWTTFSSLIVKASEYLSS